MLLSPWYDMLKIKTVSGWSNLNTYAMEGSMAKIELPSSWICDGRSERKSWRFKQQYLGYLMAKK